MSESQQSPSVASARGVWGGGWEGDGHCWRSLQQAAAPPGRRRSPSRCPSVPQAAAWESPHAPCPCARHSGVRRRHHDPTPLVPVQPGAQPLWLGVGRIVGWDRCGPRCNGCWDFETFAVHVRRTWTPFAGERLLPGQLAPTQWHARCNGCNTCTIAEIVQPCQ